MRATHDIDAHSLPGIAYSVRSGTTPEMERSTLANVYRYVLKRKAAGLTNTNGTSAKYTGRCLLKPSRLSTPPVRVSQRHRTTPGSRIPTLVLTAKLDPSVVVRAVEAGASGALSKVLSVPESVDAIKRLTDAGLSEV